MMIVKVGYYFFVISFVYLYVYIIIFLSTIHVMDMICNGI